MQRCQRLDATPSDELEKILKKMGYSDKAVKEILKWYKQSKS
ncbi:MAG: hypothetical protein QXM86_00840 [Candidatus Bathyarchaeia archaeon]